MRALATEDFRCVRVYEGSACCRAKSLSIHAVVDVGDSVEE